MPSDASRPFSCSHQCPFSCSCQLGRRKSVLHLFPIHDIPPRADVVGSLVLVLEVVRVFPDIETHDRFLAFHERIVLVRRAGDRELSAGVEQPRPARAESSHARGAELLIKLGEIPERALDRGPEVSTGLPSGLGGHDLPEHRVIPVPTAVVPDGGADRFRTVSYTHLTLPTNREV